MGPGSPGSSECSLRGKLPLGCAKTYSFQSAPSALPSSAPHYFHSFLLSMLVEVPIRDAGNLRQIKGKFSVTISQR